MDIQTYDSKNLQMNVERHIFDDSGNLKYKYTGYKASMQSYLYDEATNYNYSMEDSFLHESFYRSNIEKDKFYKYIYGVKNIEKFDLKLKKSTVYIPTDSYELKERNIEFGDIKENRLEVGETREIKNDKNITLEGLLNGYKYE